MYSRKAKKKRHQIQTFFLKWIDKQHFEDSILKEKTRMSPNHLFFYSSLN